MFRGQIASFKRGKAYTPPYTPGANTLAYYPFRDDMDDQTSSTNLSSNNAALTKDGDIKCLGLSGRRPNALIRGQSPYRPTRNTGELIVSMWFYWPGNTTNYLFLIGGSKGLLVYVDTNGYLRLQGGKQTWTFTNTNFVAGWNCITCYNILNNYIDVITNGYAWKCPSGYPTITFQKELYVGGDKITSTDFTPYLNDVIVEYSTDGHFDYSKWKDYYNNSKSYYGL